VLRRWFRVKQTMKRSALWIASERIEEAKSVGGESHRDCLPVVRAEPQGSSQEAEAILRSVTS